MLVDDDEDARDLLARLLHGEGYQTVGLASPADALTFLETTKPALVITDFEMPGMNGLTFFREIRKDPSLRHVPVIIFSARSGEVRDVALQAGIDAYLVKGSMDWAILEYEILRLAGPGTLEKRLPDVPPPRAKDAG